MLRNSLIISIFALILASCEHQPIKNENQAQQEEVQIEDTIVEEESFQTIENEEQAEKLEEKPIQLTPKENNDPETVEVQDRVFFSYDSSAISQEASKILDVQADWLKNNPEIKITIEGHCDERGTREYNIALGERRAVAAKNYLEEKGIDGSRIKTISYGKEKLASFGNSSKAHAKNRRAVVVVN